MVRRRDADGADEAGLRGLLGGGPSMIGVGGAMRARDVSRPRPEDDAEAERTLVLRKATPKAR